MKRSTSSRSSIAFRISSRRSLVVAETNATGNRYRLLETTRSYAREKLGASADLSELERRHARYFREWGARAVDDWIATPDAYWRATYLPERDNVRAALDWALGSKAIGISPLRLPAHPVPCGATCRSTARAIVGSRRPRRKSAPKRRRRTKRGFGFGSDSAGRSRRPIVQVPRWSEPSISIAAKDDTRNLSFALLRLAHEDAMEGRFDRAASLLAEARPLLATRPRPK
jgi:hypothetical protein